MRLRTIVALSAAAAEFSASLPHPPTASALAFHHHRHRPPQLAAIPVPALLHGSRTSSSATSRRSRSSSPHNLGMSSSGDDPSSSMAGKVAYQRFLYRLSPLSDCPETPYTIEERLRFRVGDDGRSLEPYGPTTYIVRDGPASSSDDDDDEESSPPPSPPDEVRPDGSRRTYVRVGPELYRLNLREGEGEQEETSEDSCVALALYLAARPELVRGKVLQLGCGSGLGGMLGCAAAGIGMLGGDDEAEESEEKEEEVEDDILPSHETSYSAPLPPSLEKLYLTDASEEDLNHALHNVKNSGVSPSKVELARFDFRDRLPRDMANDFDLILGADVAYQFPDVRHLSRTVAYGLKPSPYLGQIGDLQGGRVVHVGPKNRDAISEFRRKLRRGYRMETDVAYLDLRRYDLAPMVLNSESDEAGAELDLLSPPREDGLGRNGFVEYQNEVDSKFVGFVGQHHPDYDGYNGEYFFPAETGTEEDGAASRWVGEGNVERDEKFRKTDEGKGSWYLE